MLSLYANITLDKTGKQKTRVVLSFLPELVKITPFVSVFSGPVPHDGVLPCRRYVARACVNWPFSRLSGSRCWLTVHQYQSPEARWYECVHKVFSNDWAVRETSRRLSGDPGYHNLLLRRLLFFLRPLLEYCSPVWNPRYHCDVDKIESVQHRYTKNIGSLSNLTYPERIGTCYSAVCVRIEYESNRE